MLGLFILVLRNLEGCIKYNFMVIKMGGKNKFLLVFNISTCRQLHCSGFIKSPVPMIVCLFVSDPLFSLSFLSIIEGSMIKLKFVIL